jgi:hypothetical protein
MEKGKWKIEFGHHTKGAEMTTNGIRRLRRLTQIIPHAKTQRKYFDAINTIDKILF